MPEVPTQECVFPPATEWPRVSAPVLSQAFPVVQHRAQLSVPPGRAFSTPHGTTGAGSHQTPLLPLPSSLAVPYTGEHLRCIATASGKYCQKDLISCSCCLQNFFADLLTQAPLKAKHTLSAGPQLMRPVTSSHICSNGHNTQKIWLLRSASWIGEPLVWWEREGGKPALLTPGELNSL